MPPRSLSSILLAGLAAALLIQPNTVQAEGLIEFLWGGSSEWGGSRETVRFDPRFTPRQIIVSFGDRRLYLIARKGEAISYPIAVPREQSRWQGTTSVSSKKVNPSWRPTAEMLQENPKLPTWVPGGHPMNPLGVRAMYLGASTYRIHGTDAPWTIGQAVSKGCIRMTNEDVLDLYPRVPVGMRVTVTWQRFPTDGSAAVAANYDDTAQSAPVLRAGSTNAESRRTTPIRSLPPLPRKSSEDADAAALPEDFVALDENGNPKPAAAYAAKVKELGAADLRPAPRKPETAKVEPATKKPEAKQETAKAPDPSKPTETASTDTAKASGAPDKAAEASKSPEPSKPAETAKVPEPAIKAPEPERKTVAEPAVTRVSTGDAAAMARKAAEAAARAAAMAREAAEAAKKAAEDARKATSASSSSTPPGSDKAQAGKSAAL